MKRLLDRIRGRRSIEPAAPEATWQYIFADRPASRDPVLCFTAQVRVTWRRLPDDVPADGPHAAARLVRKVIGEVAGNCDVLRPEAAEQDISAALVAALPLTSYGLEVLDSRVQLTVDEATREAALRSERQRQDYARDSERLQQEYELDTLARRQARARADFLTAEILANPASARLYALLEHTMEHGPRLGGPPAGTDLTDLVREVQQWQPQARWVAIAQLLHDFVAGLSEEGRKELLTILANAVRVYGEEPLAQRLTSAGGEAE
ncbi:hypothetical protein [Kitasatospora sp. NBC_00039]|uniref:hypothetical protein n=1 Tax=Kitasatospora sp. NBC_00039 TaxID=2903565 RepID=UPI00324E4A08